MGARQVRRRMAASLVLLAAAFVLSLLVGRYDIRWREIFHDTMDARVFFQLRLPRTLMALCAGAGLGKRERVFCVLAYLPKATVQAAIGGVPLAMGLPCGELVLSVAVLSILLTAPLGALAIDVTAERLLQQEE